MLRFANQPNTTGPGQPIRDGHGSTGDAISVEIYDPITNQTVAVNFRFAELYTAATVWYLVIVSVFMVLQSQLEKRYQWTSREEGRRGAAAVIPALGVNR